MGEEEKGRGKKTPRKKKIRGEKKRELETGFYSGVIGVIEKWVFRIGG